MTKNEFVSKLKEMGYNVNEFEGEIDITRTAYHYDMEFSVLFVTITPENTLKFYDEEIDDELLELLESYLNVKL